MTQIALEMAVVDGVEAHERREQAPVGFGEQIADQIALKSQPPFKPLQAAKQLCDSRFVSFLTRGEACAVDAVVDRLVDPTVDLVDFPGQRIGIVIRQLVGEVVEFRVEHSQDIGRLVVDDGVGFLVPQHRYRGATGKERIGLAVELVDMAGTGQ